MVRKLLVLFLLVVLAGSPLGLHAGAQVILGEKEQLRLPTAGGLIANGKLQIHHIDVEQGDAALIISPQGQAVMVDDGRWTNCSNTINYLNALGITSIDYHFASHYHADHIGCLDDMAAAGITVTVACYDRGGSPREITGEFTNYVNTCGANRQALSKGQVISLDTEAQVSVAIRVVDLNGAGVTTTDENASSVVLKVSYGAFDAVMGGDLSGASPDIESVFAPQVGNVEVYKVHHHGSATSTNGNWLNATMPEVAIISVGSNPFGHPTLEALTRLHSYGVRTYWTNLGSGATVSPVCDKVAGTTIVQAGPGTSDSYTVTGTGFTDSYQNDGVTDDADCDGLPNPSDNCPAWPNPTQSLPPWPVRANDPDCDGFATDIENAVGTLRLIACPSTTNQFDEDPDAWPPDFDDNEAVNIVDVVQFRPVFNTTVPPTSPRFDLVPGGGINILDVIALRPFFNKSCV